MYLGTHARTTPDRTAVVMAGTGERRSYSQLYAGANRIAHALRAAGLRRGDHMAILAENRVEYFEALWAGLNSGLYVTPVNTRLTAAEAAHIIRDCGAKALITSQALAAVAGEAVGQIPDGPDMLCLDGPAPDCADWAAEKGNWPTSPLADASRGAFMFYSSGTTGRPKGILTPLPEHSVEEGDPAMYPGTRATFGMSEDTVFLSPAPLHHAAPLRVSQVAQCLGGTVVCMESFDPVGALRAIETYQVTCSQWVPTMFVRMLRLGPGERAGFDLTSHRIAVHAAAPCPVGIKEAMISWWGPILHEYYSGSENIGTTAIDSHEWLRHRGSVGRATYGTIHICDEAGQELPAGQTGTIYFDAPGVTVRYHGAPGASASLAHPDHRDWRTLGDVGHLDADGYLYLCDRRSFTIVSGGVNIYPQESENLLVQHPAVADAAVFGIPDSEFGEQVKAVVQPEQWAEVGPELAAELLSWCRERLAHYKCPRSVDFDPKLPRMDDGKLHKKSVRDRYWDTTVSRILG
ncbi:acyl-CoA synthetase [Streptomyces sp. NPDC048254]|uniref:acyl-CoA synthetase n=1 Tax=Streptomyces sp. NPDC048254 TaxID=3365525 RepID=UPI00371001D4